MYVAVIVLAILSLAGCSSKAPKPILTPGSRLIYSSGPDGQSVWTICDRGARVYLSDKGPFAAVPGGCPTGEP